MKKLILTLSLLFAVTISANAQERKHIEPEILAKKEVAILNESVELTGTQAADLYRLFEQKYKTLEDKSLSAERKAEFNRIVDMKIQATLTESQNKAYIANKEKISKMMSDLQTSK
jgi:hypothetical protein